MCPYEVLWTFTHREGFLALRCGMVMCLLHLYHYCEKYYNYTVWKKSTRISWYISKTFTVFRANIEYLSVKAVEKLLSIFFFFLIRISVEALIFMAGGKPNLTWHRNKSFLQPTNILSTRIFLQVSGFRAKLNLMDCKRLVSVIVLHPPLGKYENLIYIDLFKMSVALPWLLFK